MSIINVDPASQEKVIKVPHFLLFEKDALLVSELTCPQQGRKKGRKGQKRKEKEDIERKETKTTA